MIANNNQNNLEYIPKIQKNKKNKIIKKPLK